MLLAALIAYCREHPEFIDTGRLKRLEGEIEDKLADIARAEAVLTQLRIQLDRLLQKGSMNMRDIEFTVCESSGTVETVNCQIPHDDQQAPATHIAAQSFDGGTTSTWALVCDGHVDGWNDGSDWYAPVFKLGERLTNQQTIIDAT